MHRFLCDDYCEEDSLMSHLGPVLAWLVGVALVVLLVAYLYVGTMANSPIAPDPPDPLPWWSEPDTTGDCAIC